MVNFVIYLHLRIIYYFCKFVKLGERGGPNLAICTKQYKDLFHFNFFKPKNFLMQTHVFYNFITVFLSELHEVVVPEFRL